MGTAVSRWGHRGGGGIGRRRQSGAAGTGSSVPQSAARHVQTAVQRAVLREREERGAAVGGTRQSTMKSSAAEQFIVDNVRSNSSLEPARGRRACPPA